MTEPHPVTPVLDDEPQAEVPHVEERVGSLWSDAWYSLRHRVLFWVSAVLLLGVLVLVVAPQLFTSVDPNYADPYALRQPPSQAHVFGTDTKGRDVFAQTVYGARLSVVVGVLSTLGTAVLGSLVGLLAGYFGGWFDAVASRVGEMFLAIPLLLAGILFMYTFPAGVDTPLWVQVARVVGVIVLFGWPSIARLMRSAALQVKPQDYVNAARALGASPVRVLWSHVLPNALTPVLVVSTINLGVFIALEASLGFLGIGLQPPAVSWGASISEASGSVRTAPHMLLFPSLFLSVTVLALIMLGDAVRDALDPKSR